jgi:hypothetical protein
MYIEPIRMVSGTTDIVGQWGATDILVSTQGWSSLKTLTTVAFGPAALLGLPNDMDQEQPLEFWLDLALIEAPLAENDAVASACTYDLFKTATSHTAPSTTGTTLATPATTATTVTNPSNIVVGATVANWNDKILPMGPTTITAAAFGITDSGDESQRWHYLGVKFTLSLTNLAAGAVECHGIRARYTRRFM